MLVHPINIPQIIPHFAMLCFSNDSQRATVSSVLPGDILMMRFVLILGVATPLAEPAAARADHNLI